MKLGDVNVDYSGITDPNLLTEFNDAFSDPIKSSYLSDIASDLPGGVKSIVFKEDDVYTWEGSVSGSTLTIRINPSVSLNFPTVTLIGHEIGHHTNKVDAYSSAAADKYISENPETYKDLVDATSAKIAREIVEYGFEEAMLKVNDRMMYYTYTAPSGKRFKVYEPEYYMSVYLDAMLKQGVITKAQYDKAASIAFFSLEGFQTPFLDRVANFIGNFVEDVGESLRGFIETIGDVISGKSWKADGSFAGWTNDGWSAEYKAAGSKTGEVATVWQDGVRYYDEGVLEGQRWQAGGDVDKNGVVDERDKLQREINYYEKQSQVADYDYERKAAAKKAEELRSKQGQSNDDKGGGKMDSSPRPKDNPFYPILLDLDGDGVKITEFDKSSQFVAGKDGLQHRTSWAGAGDGVLFFDPDGRNAITEERQYVFTEWDPTATGDLEAIRSTFDSNGDGKLTAADADFAKFKVMVTNADGQTTVKTLAELGITEINLTANAVNIGMPDGSVITGQTTFTRSNGTVGTVANTSLVGEAAGHRVVETVGTDGVNRVVTQTGYGADGGVAFRIMTVTSPSGNDILRLWDDSSDGKNGGDGVHDRSQRIQTVINGDGSKVETVVNRLGSDAYAGIVDSREVTTTSAEGGMRMAA